MACESVWKLHRAIYRLLHWGLAVIVQVAVLLSKTQFFADFLCLLHIVSRILVRSFLRMQPSLDNSWGKPLVACSLILASDKHKQECLDLWCVTFFTPRYRRKSAFTREVRLVLDECSWPARSGLLSNEMRGTHARIESPALLWTTEWTGCSIFRTMTSAFQPLFRLISNDTHMWA